MYAPGTKAKNGSEYPLRKSASLENLKVTIHISRNCDEDLSTDANHNLPDQIKNLQTLGKHLDTFGTLVSGRT